MRKTKTAFTLAENTEIALENVKFIPISEKISAKQTGSGFPSSGGVSAKQTGWLQAFTLAEVLISLTIIGVIAAITVPALVQRTNKQEYAAALQKAYSTLSQATNMIAAAEGSPKAADGGWADTTEHIYDLYKKYLNNARECGTASGCLAQGAYKKFNGKINPNNFNTNSKIYKLIFADGMQFQITNEISDTCEFNNVHGNASKSVCTWFYVDLNGEKAPNTLGRDVFQFVLKENGVFPAGCDYDNTCINPSDGRECTCRVIREGRMDY